MRAEHLRGALLLAGLIVSMVPKAQALPLLTSESSVLASAYANPSEDDRQSGTTAPVTSSASQSDTGPFSGSAVVAATGSAAYGRLGGSITAVLQATAYPGPPLVWADAGANAQSETSFSDTLVFTGAGYTLGETVHIRLGLSLHDVTSIPASACSTPGCVTIQSLLTTSTDGGQVLSDDAFAPVGYQTVYWDSIAYIGAGDPLTLFGALGLDVNGLGTNGAAGFANVSASIDATNTAYVSLEVLDPGVTYVAESNTVYATTLPPEAVPEPASIGTFAAALAMLILVSWTRRIC